MEAFFKDGTQWLNATVDAVVADRGGGPVTYNLSYTDGTSAKKVAGERIKPRGADSSDCDRYKVVGTEGSSKGVDFRTGAGASADKLREGAVGVRRGCAACTRSAGRCDELRAGCRKRRRNAVATPASRFRDGATTAAKSAAGSSCTCFSCPLFPALFFLWVFLGLFLGVVCVDFLTFGCCVACAAGKDFAAEGTVLIAAEVKDGFVRTFENKWCPIAMQVAECHTPRVIHPVSYTPCRTPSVVHPVSCTQCHAPIVYIAMLCPSLPATASVLICEARRTSMLGAA